MSRLLETSKILAELNSLWDQHAKHVAVANTNLKSLIATSSKLPSAYLSTLKSINTAQNALNTSTNKLTTNTERQTRAISDLLVKRRALLSNTKTLATAVSALEAKLAKATAELNKLKAATSSTAAGQAALSSRLASTQARVAGLTARLGASTVVMQRFGTAAMFSFRTLSSLMAAFGVMTGVFLFAAITKSIFSEIRALESLDLALRNVTDTQSNFLAQQSYVAAMAEKYGLQIKNLTKQYTQWYVSAKTKLGESDIQQIFESIANAGANMGLTIESQNSVFLALEQMMSKGTVQAEELKRQLGNALPGAFEIMVKTIQKLNPELNITQKSVLDMMRKGEIMSAKVLPEFAKQMELAYGISNRNKVTTLNAEVNRLSTSWTNFVRDINGSKNRIGQFFQWFVKEASYAFDFWGDLLESDENKRKKYLDSLMVGGNNLAKTNLTFISDDVDKAKYAAEQISELTKEYEALEKARNFLIKKSANSDNDLGAAMAGGGRSSRSRTNASDDKNTIVKQEERLAVIKGLIDGYTKLEHFEDSDPNSDDAAGNRARRERVALTFDWLKAEYELKKAILERKRAQDEHDMNDETKTLAERLEARTMYSNKSLELISLEKDEEKALNVVKYAEDLERNKTAYKNKDLTAQQYTKNISDLNKRLNFEQLKADETYSIKFKQLVFDNTDFSMKMNEKRLEYSRKLTKAEVDFFIAQNTQILERKNVSDAEWIQSSQQIRDAEFDQAVKARDEALRLAGDEAVLKKAIWAEYGNTVFNINKKLEDSLEAMSRRRAEREREIADLRRDAYGYKPVKGNDKRGFLSGADKETVKQYEELLDNYQKAVEEGDESIIAERKRQLDDFKDYVIKTNEFIESFFESFKSSSGFETLFDVLGNKIEGFGENWKTTLLAVSEIAQEVFAFMSQNSAEYFDAERERLKSVYDYNVELAGDNKAAKTDLDKQYEREKREINMREAKAKRDAAIFNIAVDTAQAIIGLWVNPGFPAAIPLAIGVGALGIAQAAKVSSKPLPQYFTGVENADAGYAYTDERGPELHLNRFGKIKDFGSNKGARIKYIEKGDTILPANKTKSILDGTDFAQLDEILFKNNISYHENNNNQLDASGIISSIDSLKQHLINSETNEEVYDVRGYTKYKRINGTRVEEKNNRIRFKK